MSLLLGHHQANRLGMVAPPTDRPLSPGAPRTFQRQHLSRYRLTEATSPCAALALRRRLSTTGGSSSPTTPDGSRTGQLFELDREGGYSASTPAPAPGANGAASGGADGLGLLDDGWGVVAAGAPPTQAAAKSVAKREKKKQKKQAAVSEPPRQRERVAMPYVEKSSEAGLMGLTLLQQRLIEEGRISHASEQKAKVAAEAAARRERLAKTVRRKRDWVAPEDLDVGEGEAEEMDIGAREQQYFEFNLEADGSTEVVEFDSEGRVVARRAPGTARRGDAADDEEDRASSRVDRGRGREVGRRRAAADDEDDDPLAFLADLDSGDNTAAAARAEGKYDDDDDGGDLYDRKASGAAAGPSRRRGSGATVSGAPARRGARTLYDDDDDDDEDEETELDGRGRPMPGQNPLEDEEIEWGLDELRPAGQRTSLLRELGVIKTPSSKKPKQQQPREEGQQRQLAGPQGVGGKGLKEGAAAAGKDAASRGKQQPALAYGDDDEGYDNGVGDERDVGVSWGGSGGASGIDMEQQEELLTRLFKPHKVKELMAHQRAAEAELAAMKKKASGRQVLESKLQSRMRIISGSAAGKQLTSSRGATTRPMMEKVRQAIFNMIQAQAGSGAGLPPTARWLDVFAGTGSVGLEALSRGCRECHFIELDPWVCRKVLSRNIATCGFQRQSVVHTMKAEDFLRRSIELPRFAGGPFEFLSVCPPYLVVSYPELMDLLERSPLLHDRSIVFVEYPKQLTHQVPPTLGPLVTVRDRKYGRTYIRVYGPSGGPAWSDEDEEGPSGASEGEGDELLL